MNRKLRISLALTALWFVLAASCNSKAEGGSTPEVVAKALTQAVESKSYGDLLPLVAPDDRDIFVGVIVFAAGFSNKSKDDIVELKRKYDLDSKPSPALDGSHAQTRKAIAEWLGDIDRNALLIDALRILESRGEVRIPSGQLTDLELEGDKGEGKLGGKPVLFVRERGRWYLALPRE